MTLEAQEVRSFGNVKVYVGEVGATEPATLADAPDEAEWFEVGHTGDNGIRFSFGKARTPFRSHQSYPDPVRVVKGEAITSVSIDLLQWNRDNLAYALGGGEWAEAGGEFTFEPADAAEDTERAIIIDAFDGEVTYRFIARRTEVQSNVDFTWSPTALAPLPIQAVLLAAPGDDKAYALVTDDDAMGS